MSFVDFKEVANIDTGDAVHYGSDQLLEVLKIFNGKTILNRRVNIKNPWRFADHFEVVAPTSLPTAPTSTNTVNVVLDPADFHLKVQRSTGILTDLESFTLDTNNLAYSAPGSNVVGDILRNDGTKYGRFGRGTNGQVLSSTSSDIQWGLISDASVAATASIQWSKLNKATSKLSDLSDTNLPSPANGQVPTWDTATSKWKNQTPPGSSVGEANTASNQGAGGVGPFITKSGVDLQFKNINVGSNKLSVTNDTTNKEIDLDVIEANLTLSNIGGSVTNAQTPTTPTGKTYGIDTNTINHSTTNAQGDILKYDTTATKYVRIPRGTTGQVLQSSATDIGWVNPASAASITCGLFVSQGDGATTVYHINHGVTGTIRGFSLTPGSPSTIRNIAGGPFTAAQGVGTAWYATINSTEITLTYVVAPATGTQNVQWQWIVIS